MRVHPAVWVLRVCWLILPFTLGTTLSDALYNRSDPVGLVAAVLAWTIWGAVLLASMVPLPTTLTILRILVPAGGIGAIATSVLASSSAAPDRSSGAHVISLVVGLVAALAATAAALSSPVADEYVNGAAYGDERRFSLRVPVTFMFGPIPVFWMLCVASGLAAPLFFAAKVWWAGAALLCVAVVVARPALTSFHALSRRWIVFVPAGVTLVDHLSVVDPVLFAKKVVSNIAPAVVGTAATDLTHGAPGLAVEISTTSPVELTRRLDAREGEVQMVSAILLTPGRPGAVISEAARRGLSTGV